jgi:hypothetical protein
MQTAASQKGGGEKERETATRKKTTVYTLMRVG